MYEVRIVIADSDKSFRHSLKNILRQLDYLVAGEAAEATSALEIIFQAEPEVIVMDPYITGREGIDLTSIIDEHKVAPIVAVASYAYREIEEYAGLPGVYGVLTKPLVAGAVQPVIESAIAVFNRLLKCEKELSCLRKELENRKVIERAKGILMERKNLSEKDAYKTMQKISMDKCVSLAKVAESIILRFGRTC